MSHANRAGAGPGEGAGASASNGSLRIAIVAPSLDILGGQGVQACSLAQALRGDGFAVNFIPVNPGFPRGLRWLRKVPVLRTVINQCLYLISLVQLRRADAVHVFSAAYWSFLLAPAPAIAVARLFGKRVILNYHSGEADDHLSNWGFRVHPVLRRADEIVVPSPYLQAVFAKHGYATKVVHNIVDIADFHYRQRSPLQPRLLSNRNLETHYRVDNVLRAFALLKQRRPDAQLFVAGYGSEAARLQQWVKAERLSGVEFLGRVEPEAMPALYDQADIFVNASVIDNQPISILEAFAAGLPVVSTPTGDIPHMLASGRRGTLVPADDPSALAAALISLLDCPDQATAMALRARAEVENYSWVNVRPKWLAVYNNEADLNRSTNESSGIAARGSNGLDGSGDETTTSP